MTVSPTPHRDLPVAPSAAPRPVGVPAVAGRVLAMLLLVVAAAGLGLALPHLPSLVAVDASALTAVSAATPPLAAQVAALIDLLFGGPVAPFVLLAVLVAGFLLTRSRRATARMTVLVVVPWAVSAVLKVVVQRPRPEASLSVVDLVPSPVSWSFPSGHTAFAAALVCGILLTVPAGRTRRLLLLPALAVIAVTAWSRVALGVHFPLDVLVSAILVPMLSALLAGMLPAARGRTHDA